MLKQQWVRGNHWWSWRCVQGPDLLVQTCKPIKMIVTCCGDGVIPFICALAGRTLVRQRPAGGGERRVSAGLLQPSGHGDTSPLHVPGGERQRDHPAGCTEGYEGNIGVPGIRKEVNIPHMNSVSIKPESCQDWVQLSICCKGKLK